MPIINKPFKGTPLLAGFLGTIPLKSLQKADPCLHPMCSGQPPLAAGELNNPQEEVKIKRHSAIGTGDFSYRCKVARHESTDFLFRITYRRVCHLSHTMHFLRNAI